MLRRIAETIREYHMLSPGEPVLCGFSGGSDSTALVLSLLQLGYPVTAAHIHHGIRGDEADRDAGHCADFCKERGIPFVLRYTDVPRISNETGAGLEETARNERYRLLRACAGEAGCKKIATGHNAGDFAETVLFHLIRGTGPSGLTGIPPVRDEIIRPMLRVTRAEVQTFLQKEGASFVEDSTNSCEDYTRNAIRRRIMPAALDINPDFYEAVLRCGGLLREDEAFLNETAAEGLKNGLPGAAELTAMPKTLSSRMVRLAYTQYCGKILEYDHTSACLSICAGRAPSTCAVLPGGVFFVRNYNHVRFTNNAPKPGPALPKRILEIGKWTKIPEIGLKIGCFTPEKDEIFHNMLNSFYIGRDRIEGAVTVRSRRCGDIFKKISGNGTKLLKKMFIDDKIPFYGRLQIPVIADSEKVLAVTIYGVSADAAAAANESALKIIIEPEQSNGDTVDR